MPILHAKHALKMLVHDSIDVSNKLLVCFVPTQTFEPHLQLLKTAELHSVQECHMT